MLSVKIKDPAIIGIYFLINVNRIVYIGSSRDVWKRLRTHKSNLKMVFSHYTILPYSTLKDAKIMEKAYIKKLTPKYNIKDNPVAKQEMLLAIQLRKKRGDLVFSNLMSKSEVDREFKIAGLKSKIKDPRI